MNIEEVEKVEEVEEVKGAVDSTEKMLHNMDFYRHRD